MTNNNDYLRIALQKSGRLKKDSLNYLAQTFNQEYKIEDDALFYQDTKNKIEFVFLREKDIATFVSEGVVDMGILGFNTFMEGNDGDYNRNPYQPLGFSECKLVLAVPENQPYAGIDDLDAKTIATSYPNILQRYLKLYGIEADIKKMTGSVEVAPRAGYADAVCDLVETGTTLQKNNLKQVGTIFSSQAVAIFNPAFEEVSKSEMTVERLLEIKQNMNNETVAVNSYEPLIECRLARTY